MKVSLIVVQGKPEGKVIPLTGPQFRIGRGVGCQLRPNDEQVSRQHAEIEIKQGQVIVRDLGSRNGTILNKVKLEPNTDRVVSSQDLLQIGNLTFALVIQGAPAVKSQPQVAGEASNDQVDSWLVGGEDKPAPERPSGVYSGDTMTFETYQQAEAPPAEQPSPEQASESSSTIESESDEEEVEEEVVEEEEVEEEVVEEDVAEETQAVEQEENLYDTLDDEEGGEETPEDFVDESNPFYAAKQQEVTTESASSKQKMDADSSQAAEDILRKMMERRRATR